MELARANSGRFAKGNKGGPGRPPRAVERTYLATLADSISIDDWRAICGKAVELAKNGDPRAREWITRHVLGPEPMSLFDLALREQYGVDVAHEIEVRAEAATESFIDHDSFGPQTEIGRAIKAATE